MSVSNMLANTDYVNFPTPNLATKNGKKGLKLPHGGFDTTPVNRCFSFAELYRVLPSLHVNPPFWQALLEKLVSKMLAKYPTTKLLGGVK